jgi:hypothetical protein
MEQGQKMDLVQGLIHFLPLFHRYYRYILDSVDLAFAWIVLARYTQRLDEMMNIAEKLMDRKIKVFFDFTLELTTKIFCWIMGFQILA